MKYHATDIEVRLGDRVIYRHLFFGKSMGIVAYIPGVSAPDQRVLPHQWVVKLDNGKGLFMAYGPDLEFAHQRVEFMERSDREV